jgi:hypothetical protein
VGDAAIFTHPTGRAAIRRMNQMHGAYVISNDDLLGTFPSHAERADDTVS